MLHLGIIGCGRVTTMFHLKAISAVESLETVAVSDTNKSRLKKVKKASGARNDYLNYKELLCDPLVDAVAINVPPNFHEEMVLEALKEGKHILCEKPLAQTVEGCNKIKDLKENVDLVVLPAHNYAFTPSLHKMIDLINNDEIGKIQKISICFKNNLKSYRSQTRFRIQNTNGLVEDILPHILSVSTPLVGKTTQVSDVDWWCKTYDVCDNMNLTLKTETKVPIVCSMSWTSIIPCFMVDVIGSEGEIHSDLMIKPYNTILKTQDTKKTFKEKGFSWYLDLIRYKHPSFVNQYIHLVELITQNAKPLISIDDEISFIKTMNEVSLLLEDSIIE